MKMSTNRVELKLIMMINDWLNKLKVDITFKTITRSIGYFTTKCCCLSLTDDCHLLKRYFMSHFRNGQFINHKHCLPRILLYIYYSDPLFDHFPPFPE